MNYHYNYNYDNSELRYLLTRYFRSNVYGIVHTFNVLMYLLFKSTDNTEYI